jgi:hypothetical protein
MLFKTGCVDGEELWRHRYCLCATPISGLCSLGLSVAHHVVGSVDDQCTQPRLDRSRVKGGSTFSATARCQAQSMRSITYGGSVLG